MKVAIVGGGIAGLAIGVRLQDRHDVTVFEREPRAGGKIRSEQRDGYVFEWGPLGFLGNASELRALVDEVGLGDALVAAAPAAVNRFIYWDGALHRLPTKPPEALRMSLLSPLGRTRALAELLVPRRRGSDDSDESVLAFAARRFGREAAERLVAPAVLGVSAGDAAATGVDALFPRLRGLEREHGSVLRGMIRARAGAGRLHGFAGGLQTLTARLAERLGPRVRLGTPVEALVRDGAGWRLRAGAEEHPADRVVLATPAPAAATLLRGLDPGLADELGGIGYAPLRVVGIAFRAADVPVPLDGFGFLAARGQGVRSLGAIYTSTIFPPQAPPGVAYLRVLLGGATDPGVAALEPPAVAAIVRGDLALALRVRAEPIAVHDVFWPQAIPQYGLEHRTLMRRIDARVAAHAGLALAGNAYRGLGLGDNVRDALSVAARIDAG